MNLKLKRAGNITGYGKYPRTYEDILKNIPEELINGITSKQLAMVLEVNQKAYSLGMAKGEEDINEYLGCKFWDKAEKFAEVVDR
jgi:hypothetical protein